MQQATPITMMLLILVGLGAGAAGSARAEAAFPGDPSSGLEPARIPTPKREGTLLGVRGEATVGGNMGDLVFGYDLPFPVWRGFQPLPRLEYHSGAGNGPLGQGFALTLPHIERTKQFGVPGAATLFTSSLDGLLNPTPDGYLRARIEGSFRLYKFVSDGFWMKDGKGNVYHFGTTDASREKDGALTTGWSLDEVIDPFGNTFHVDYQSDGGLSLPVTFTYLDAGGQVVYTFALAYEGRPDAWVSYRGGIRQQLSKRLKTITGTATSGGRIFRVELGYDEVGVSHRSVLTRLTRYGATDADRVPATSFRYSGDQLTATDQLQTVTLTGAKLPELLPHSVKWLDLNGDGLPDLIARVAGSGEADWYVWYNKGNGHGFADPVRLPLQGFTLDDSNHGVIDVDGDRRPDLVYFDGAQTLAYRAQAAAGGYVWSQTGEPLAGFDVAHFGDPAVGAWVDLDADGRTDYLAFGDGTLALYHNVTPPSGAIKFEMHALSGAAAGGLVQAGHHPRNLGDLNGDGLPDLYELVNQGQDSSYVSVNLNQGNGTFSSETLTLPIKGKPLNVPSHRLVDVNGDGLPDLVLSDGVVVQVFLNTGAGFVPMTSGDFDFDQNQVDGTKLLESGDLLGNGSTDLIFVKYAADLKVYDPYAAAAVKAPFVMTGYDTELGETVAVGYASSVTTYADGDDEHRFPATFQVATSQRQWATTATAGQAAAKVLNLRHETSYHAGAYDRTRNEFLGFSVVEQSGFTSGDEAQVRGDKRVTTYFTAESSGALRGRVRDEKRYGLSDGHLYAHLANDWIAAPLFPGSDVWLPLLKREDQTNTERDGTSRTASKTHCTKFYQPIMVPAEDQTSELAEDGSVYRSWVRIYDQPGKRWVTQFPREMRLLRGDGGTASGRRFDCVADTTRVTAVYRFLSGDWQRYTSFDYDAAGTVARVVDAEGHRTDFAYEDGRGYLPSTIATKTDEGLALVKKVTYHPAWEQAATVTDENGNVQAFGYDGLGRVVAITPFGETLPEVRLSYQWGDAGSLSTVTVQERSVARPEIQSFDALQRRVFRRVPAAGGDVLKDFKIYGTGALVTTESLDQNVGAGDYQLEANRFIADEYDDLGRPTRRHHPQADSAAQYHLSVEAGGGIVDKGVEAWAYGAADLYYYDEEGSPKRTHRDLFGRDDEIREAYASQGDGAVTRLGWDHADRLVTLQVGELPARTYAYDEAGRMAEFHGPDLGRLRWTYDKADRALSAQQFNKDDQPMATVFYRYDGLGREVERRVLEGKTGDAEAATRRFTFHYDTARDGEAGNVVGRLSGLTVFAGADYAYGYDKAGRKSLEALTLYGKKHLTRMRYDASGRLTGVGYPDGSDVAYGMNELGQVQSVGDLVSGVVYDALNRTKTVQLKSGLTEDFAYDSRLDLLRQYQVNGVAGLAFGMSYDHYDYRGRITGRATKAGQSDVAEAYAYDERGQLRDATVSFAPPAGAAATLSGAYEFTEGGMPEKLAGQSVIYDRGAAGDLRHVKVGEEDYLFGDFGRVVGGSRTKTVGWLGEGRIACLKTASAVRTRYSYLPDGHRFTSVTEAGGKVDSVVYVNDYALYHKETGAYELYYMLNGRRLAVKTPEGAVRLLAQDQVGSTRAALAPDGKLVSHAVYGPFGEAVGAVDGEALRYGFGGGLVDGGIASVQLKTRFYAPGLSLFMSADEYLIQHPGACGKRTIECNFFSYGRNDPLNHRDADGQFAQFVAGAIIGAVVGSAIEYAQGGDKNHIIAAAVGGAIAGAGVGLGPGGAMLLSGVAKTAQIATLNALDGKSATDFTARNAGEIAVAAVSGGIANKLGSALTGGASEKMLEGAKALTESAEHLVLRAEAHEAAAKIYQESAVQIEGAAEREVGRAVELRAVAEATSLGTGSRGLAGAVGAGSEGPLGSLYETSFKATLGASGLQLTEPSAEGKAP